MLEIETGRRWRISESGGGPAGWSQASNELLFRNGAGVHSVTFELDPEFDPAAPVLRQQHPPREIYTDLAISPDGERVISRVTNEELGDATQGVEVVLNWFTELLERAPLER